MEKSISKLVNRFIDESFVDITDKNEEEAFKEVTERLHGKQHKLDVAKPKGKITKADFDMLRKRNKTNRYMEESETEEGNEFTGELARARREDKKTFKVGNKTYPVKENVNKKIERIIERRKRELGEKSEDNIEIIKTGSYHGKDLKELQRELASMNLKIDKYEKDGKEVPGRLKRELQQIKNAIKFKRKNLKENKVIFTESQLIDFIERIVESEIKTDKETSKSLNTSKKVNSDAINSVVNKMKDYMKNMGTDYNPNSESFPKGNEKMARQGKDGEVTDGVKKAYKASSGVEEYIENFTAAGLENLDYDNIKPNEDWVTDNIEGSSRTGNNPEWANAVETPVNKKINEKRKKNLLAVLKRQAYNKSPQPVHSDEAGESVPSSLAGAKNTEVNKIMTTESLKTKQVINEMEKMKNLFNYNQKTQ
jgi:hypothetical protein